MLYMKTNYIECLTFPLVNEIKEKFNNKVKIIKLKEFNLKVYSKSDKTKITKIFFCINL